ncbi:MAG: DUF2029 domain-containing protein [Burkholderiales bacterium]|nr:DUF2029 domain-containing protein [Phycisphaerae bacterium]
MADPIGYMAIALPHILRPAPMRKRLWQYSVLLATATLVFVLGNAFLPVEKAVSRQMLGHDFLAFYTGGTFVREGRVADLYDLRKVADFEQSVATAAGLDITVSFEKQKFGPWWNPPFYAWVFAPLSLLSFSSAVAVWTLINIAALGAAVLMLTRMLAPRLADVDAMGRPLDWRTTGLVPLLLLLSMPFVQAISHGQNTLISLCLLCAVATCWRAKRAFLAGAFCALLGYKPQLAAVVACVLVISMGVRALIGLGLVGSFLVLITQATMPGALVDYLHRLPANIHYMQVEHAYLWERHATLKAFWRLLVQGREAGEMWLMTSILHAVSFVAIATLLIRAAWSHWTRPAIDDCWSSVTEQTWRDRLISATIACAPLLMPFYFDYDLLLLAIPATLMATEALSRPADQSVPTLQKWLNRTWLALYAWMLINPGMASATRVNLNVVLLSAVAVMMLQRATRPTLEHRVAGQPALGAITMGRRAA